MKPYFSIIVPYHNSSKTIGALLDSIQQSKKIPPLEVIIVDDGSKDTFVVPSSWFLGRKKKKLQTTRNQELRTVHLQANHGPAKARNRGAEKAKGKFLVFLDSDVELLPDALHNLWEIYKDDPDIVAVTGVWMKHQKTKAFFPNFKALRDWSYWINERDKSGYYYLFSTRIASIKRDVFARLKGFDETYAGPLVEDIEFTYRVARRYAIIFAPNVRVRHEFEDFFPIAKKYFWRSYYWTKLYQQRKRFDPVATTLEEAVAALSGVSVVAIGLFWFFIIYMSPLWYRLPYFFMLWIAITCLLFFSMFVHGYLIRRFLLFVLKEKGIIFTIQSFFVGLALYVFIVFGAFWGKVY